MVKSSKEDFKSGSLWRDALAELLGTFFLVLIGCGSCSKFPYNDGKQEVTDDSTNVVHLAFAFGLAVATVVWSLVHLSGGHINPAVSIAFFVTRKISFIRTILFVAAQVLGGTVAAFLLKALTPNGINDNLCSPLIHSSVSVVQALVIELSITFILVFTVFATCDRHRKVLGSGPLAIGFAVTICHLWAVPYTGSSMNPARALASQIASENLGENVWIYWVGPIVGGMLAGLLYDLVFSVNSSVGKLKGFFSKDFDDEDYDGKNEE